MKIGIIGCGFIGSELALFIDREKNFEVAALYDIVTDKAQDLAKSLKNNKPKVLGINELVKCCDLIIESAKRDVVQELLGNKLLDKKGKKLMVMSTGGLIGGGSKISKLKHLEILTPSGAIAGLDAIRAVAGKIDSLSLTTTKSARSLANAPYIMQNKIDLFSLKEKKTIFEGKLKDAVDGFPQNINVAATLYLASKFDGIKIKIVADPETKYNTHEIEATGCFGEIKTVTKNLPSEKNPRTSYLALMSAISVLKGIKG